MTETRTPRPPRERARDPWWIGAAVFFVVLSPVAAGLSRGASGTRLTTYVVLQAVATGLAFLIPLVLQMRAAKKEETAEEREIEARVDTRVAMNDALDPILRLLGNLAVETDHLAREQIRAQVFPLVLKTAAEFIGPERSRACWFRLEPGPPRRLVGADYAGRAGQPTAVFEEGSPDGQAAVDLVLRDEDLLCTDIEVDPPPGWDSTKTRDYRTFISVSVIAGDTAYGMVTLDALEPGSLTDEDMSLLHLMAEILAVALSVD